MYRESVESSNVKSRGYDHATRTLEVEFVGGAVYRYEDFPIEAWEAWKSAGSVGSYFAQYIRPNYDGVRVS
jgi:hypothetical protein